MKSAILLIVASSLSLTVCCQPTNQVPLSDINHYLAEGLECKELLENTRTQVGYLDSIRLSQGKIIDNLNTAVKLADDNLWHSQSRSDLCMMQLTKLEADNKRLWSSTRTYRTLAIVFGLISVGGGAYLILK